MNLCFRAFLLLPLLALLACNPTRRLPKNETLLNGYRVKVSTPEKGKSKTLSSELSALLRPRPNSSILGIRYKLFFWNLVDTPRGKGVRSYLRNKLGEPPVLASDVNLEKNRLILQNRLENDGFFHASVTADSTTSQKKRTTTVRFAASTGPQYKIREVHWLDDTTLLGRYVDSVKKQTLLKPGKPYNLGTIRDERARVDAALKEKGYYYFSPEYLIADVDSTVDTNQVDIFFRIKETAPDYAVSPYQINNIWVYDDYSIEKDSLLAEAPSEKHYGYNIIDPEHKFRPRVFKQTLIFHPYETYNRKDHNRSLNRLVNMGTFRFVKARFEEVDTAGHYLDPYYFLTPLPKKSLRAEVTGLTKSNNATGGELTLSFRNRNAFRGAELFTFSAFGGIEQQVSGNVNVGTIRYGLEANLYIPRILGFVDFARHSPYVPRTRINLAGEFFNRTSQYTLTSFRGSYGFQWKSSAKTEYLVNILSANYVAPTNIQPAFQALLDTNITLRRSIERQFILGPNANYNYNDMAEPNDRRNNYYFNFNVDVPGNILGFATGTTFNKEKEGNGKFLGSYFSQYARFEIEGRHYLRLSPENKTSILASRLLGGLGIPYGNSDQLPFIKQFFIGGANSIRAFRARSLGPGTYYVRNFQKDGFLPDQPGDIKIEANTELRAKLVSILHGAVFVDAGNIWTLHDDPERPGSKFTNKFLNQFAVGAGLGIRLDISFLVLRLDLATPIRKPYLPGGPAWVFDQFDIGSASWRKENLILNLAIGYPF